MTQKIKYWWSQDRKWFCIQLDDGTTKATVSLTPEEAGVLSMHAVQDRPPQTGDGFYAEVRTKGDLRDFKTGDLHLNQEPR